MKISTVILIFLSGLLLNCRTALPNPITHHLANRDQGSYRPIDNMLAKYGQTEFLHGTMPALYGEYVIPVMAKSSEVGEVIVQKGAMTCILIYFCTQEMTLNDYRDIFSKNISTLDYRIRTRFGIVTDLDILISYSPEKK